MTTTDTVSTIDAERVAADRDAERRAEYAKGLRDLADLIEWVAVPLPFGPAEVRLSLHGDDDTALPALARAAALLGTEITYPVHPTHPTVRHDLPGGARYEVFHVLDEAMALHRARSSYRDNIATSSTATPSGQPRPGRRRPLGGDSMTTDFDARLDAVFGPCPPAGQRLIDASIDIHAASVARAKQAVPDARLNEILDYLNNALIHRYYVGGDYSHGGELERDWDPQDFAAYARTLPEVDWTLTDDPEGEIFLLGGTVLWFDRSGPCWEPALASELAEDAMAAVAEAVLAS